jgi:hypothetical protein
MRSSTADVRRRIKKLKELLIPAPSRVLYIIDPKFLPDVKRTPDGELDVDGPVMIMKRPGALRDDDPNVLKIEVVDTRAEDAAAAIVADQVTAPDASAEEAEPSDAEVDAEIEKLERELAELRRRP